MAGIKISALPPVTVAQFTDTIAAVQNGVTSRETLQQIFDLFGGITPLIVWNDVTTTSVNMVAGEGYMSNNVGLVSLALPVTAAQFSIIEVAGFGSGGWTITQNAGQSINFGNKTTTPGAGGSLSSTNRYDAVRLLCTVADTTWDVLSGIGNITYV